MIGGHQEKTHGDCGLIYATITYNSNRGIQRKKTTNFNTNISCQVAQRKSQWFRKKAESTYYDNHSVANIPRQVESFWHRPIWILSPKSYHNNDVLKPRKDLVAVFITTTLISCHPFRRWKPRRTRIRCSWRKRRCSRVSRGRPRREAPSTSGVKACQPKRGWRVSQSRITDHSAFMRLHGSTCQETHVHSRPFFFRQ